jgi:hypothetical protein
MRAKKLTTALQRTAARMAGIMLAAGGLAWGQTVIVDGNDSLGVWNTGARYLMKFNKADGGLGQFFFSDAPDTARQDLVLTAGSGEVYIAQAGSNAPDLTLLAVAVRSGTIKTDFSLRVRWYDYDSLGANPAVSLDTTVDKAAFDSPYAYGKQAFKPHFAQDSTGLPFITGETALEFKFLLLDLHAEFAAGITDHMRIQYDVNAAYAGIIALNVYGVSANDGGIKWTNATAVAPATSSCRITLAGTGIRALPHPVALDRPTAPAAFYDLQGCRLHAAPAAGLYLMVAEGRISKQLLVR